ncbi:MAG: hypothetical protein A07HR60_01832 [uncultured archaeon A07HR60]|nr:MAG: hypothetical protein A07HR60_01832 [uncultured archaeon A07HR60]
MTNDSRERKVRGSQIRSSREGKQRERRQKDKETDRLEKQQRMSTSGSSDNLDDHFISSDSRSSKRRR